MTSAGSRWTKQQASELLRLADEGCTWEEIQSRPGFEGRTIFAIRGKWQRLEWDREYQLESSENGNPEKEEDSRRAITNSKRPAGHELPAPETKKIRRNKTSRTAQSGSSWPIKEEADVEYEPSDIWAGDIDCNGNTRRFLHRKQPSPTTSPSRLATSASSDDTVDRPYGELGIHERLEEPMYHVGPYRTDEAFYRNLPRINADHFEQVATPSQNAVMSQDGSWRVQEGPSAPDQTGQEPICDQMPQALTSQPWKTDSSSMIDTKPPVSGILTDQAHLDLSEPVPESSPGANIMNGIGKHEGHQQFPLTSTPLLITVPRVDINDLLKASQVPMLVVNLFLYNSMAMTDYLAVYECLRNTSKQQNINRNSFTSQIMTLRHCVVGLKKHVAEIVSPGRGEREYLLTHTEEVQSLFDALLTYHEEGHCMVEGHFKGIMQVRR
ncbi:hypothetical protein BDW74DRAFT_172856 [Aspergillus multicolor]|uniref:uncharacterized protein n=1 Tax=Aspergillus multicolor TaxID=41759 RepID=UPI003CCCF024